MADDVSQETSTETSADEPSFLERVDQRIAEVLGKFLDAGKITVAEGKGDPAKPAPAAGVADEVKSAMEHVLAGERARQEAEGKDAAIAAKDAEIARLKSLIEKPPELERWIERFMGWRLKEKA